MAILFSILLSYLANSDVYNGPLEGSVSSEQFKLEYVSDWSQADRRISNRVENKHESKELVVTWPKAFIVCGMSNPIRPRDPPYMVAYACTKLAIDSRSVLEYSLSGRKVAAPVYYDDSAKAASRDVVSSVQFAAADGDGAYRLEVKSQFSERQAVYSFSANRPYNLSLALPPGLTRKFAAAADWKDVGRTLEKVDGSPRLAELEWPYRVNWPTMQTWSMPGQSSTVRVEMADAAPRPVLIVISTQGRFLGTGAVSLHLPIEEVHNETRNGRNDN